MDYVPFNVCHYMLKKCNSIINYSTLIINYFLACQRENQSHSSVALPLPPALFQSLTLARNVTPAFAMCMT